MERLSTYIHRSQGELWLTETDRDNLTIHYRIKEVIFDQQSSFQHVMIVDSYDFGRMLVLDGAVQTTSQDGFIYNEMISHVPLTLHPNPERVLIIGGGDCGVAREVCKHPQVKQIDMVEIDELVVKACKQYLPEVSGNLSDPRVQFIFTDGVQYVKNKESIYDVIIVDSSDPVGPAVQLFELDFYRNLHQILKPDGMMVCQSQSPLFHTDIMKQSYSHIQSLFAETQLYIATVPTYPGGFWSYTLGSKMPLPSRSELRFHLETQYVNEDVLVSCFKLPEFIKRTLNS